MTEKYAKKNTQGLKTLIKKLVLQQLVLLPY